MGNRIWLAALALAAAAQAGLAAERVGNWHHWRGPNADGTAPEADPPVEWSEEKNVRWKVEVPGRGSSTPIIWGDKLFLLTAVSARPEGANQDAPREAAPRRGRGGRGGGFGRPPAPTDPQKFVVLCLDRTTGETLWERVVREEVPHEGHHGTNTFASGSPTTDGEFLYASFGSRGIYCLDLDGNVVWERDLGDMRTRNGFGEGSSPALHGDTLVVTWDHEADSFITALDAKTGEPRWKVARDEVTTWATPFIVEHEGRTQVITNGTNRARSYDLETGELIWECGGQATNPIATPVVGDGVTYLVTGHRGYAVTAVPLDATGDLTGTDGRAWHRGDVGSYIASPVLLDGLLYVTKSRDAIVTCLDAKTGETVTPETRLQGLKTLYASPIAAAGRIYYADRDGATAVLEQGRELKVLATNTLDEGVDASPVAVGKQLFLRGGRHLYCLEEGASN